MGKVAREAAAARVAEQAVAKEAAKADEKARAQEAIAQRQKENRKQKMKKGGEQQMRRGRAIERFRQEKEAAANRKNETAQKQALILAEKQALVAYVKASKDAQKKKKKRLRLDGITLKKDKMSISNSAFERTPSFPPPPALPKVPASLAYRKSGAKVPKLGKTPSFKLPKVSPVGIGATPARFGQQNMRDLKVDFSGGNFTTAPPPLR